MRVFVKTLKGTSFEIQAELQNTVADVKKTIETAQGKNVYPAEHQMLIHQGKILKDETTLQDNQVIEDSFLVIMLTKTKGSSSGASTTKAAPANLAPPVTPVAPNSSTPESTPPQAPASTAALAPASTPAPTATAAPAAVDTAPTETDTYGQAASNLVAGNSFEQAVQSILDMGGGTWERDTVIRALRAAYNNPERAVDYLYSGVPGILRAPPPLPRSPSGGEAVNSPSGGQAVNSPVQATPPLAPAVPSTGGPNANPLDLFPQGLPAPSVGSNAGAGGLDFLRNSQQFRTLQAMVQANPQILQPMLRELAKQNPQIMRLIQEHQVDFLRLINEPVEGAEGDLLGQLEGAAPQTVTVTPEEAESIERLEAMGFDHALVLEVFFACNKNEELAANYLLDHMNEFEE